jgi:hypothetical protein
MILAAIVQAFGVDALPPFQRLCAQLRLAADDGGILTEHRLRKTLATTGARLQINELVALLVAASVIEPAAIGYCLHGEGIRDVEGALRLQARATDSPIDVWAPVATLPAGRGRAPEPVRETAGVIFSLVEQAKQELWVVTPFLDPLSVNFLRAPIANALSRGVVVHILTAESNESFVEELIGPMDAPPAKMYVTYASDDLSQLGSHAKAVVADRERAYLGSANLTSYGLTRHFELGALLQGPSVEAIVRLFAEIADAGRARTPTDD